MMVKIVGSRLRELGRSSQSDRWPASRAVAAIKHEDNIRHMTYTLENVYKMNVTGLLNTYVLLASMRQSLNLSPIL